MGGGAGNGEGKKEVVALTAETEHLVYKGVFKPGAGVICWWVMKVAWPLQQCRRGRYK